MTSDPGKVHEFYVCRDRLTGRGGLNRLFGLGVDGAVAHDSLKGVARILLGQTLEA